VNINKTKLHYNTGCGLAQCLIPGERVGPDLSPPG
jgi:hypothetical protein